MKKYIVVEICQDGYAEVFDTLDEANANALMKWKHLTTNEKKTTNIYVEMITEDDLYDTAIDEDSGAIDWLDFSESHPVEGGFDSGNEISANWRMAKYIGGKMVDLQLFNDDTITSFTIEKAKDMMHDDDDPADTTYAAEALTYGGKWVKLDMTTN